MKRIKENQSNQGILFSNHYVGDRLSEDDEVFLFEKLFDQLDISAVTDVYSSEGGSMFSPRDQLAVILFAFSKGITSSVKIAELLRYNLQFIYLAGGHQIKRRTICDFRLKHINSLQDIFESSINLAIESGLVKSTDLFALDGCKIEAHASMSNTRKKKEWEERQRLIVEHVDNFLKEWEEQDQLEEDLEQEKKDRFKEISDKLEQIKKRKNEKEKRSKTDEESGKHRKKKPESNRETEDSSENKRNRIDIKDVDSADKYLEESQKIDDLLDEYDSADNDMFLNLTDSDCRIMKSDSITKECYNMQAISNDNQVIVALNVTQDENDQGQLEPMAEQLKENLNIEEKIKLLADAGYNRGKNLCYLDQEELIDPYISMYNRSEKNNPKYNEYHKENFSYNEEEDYWICPGGEQLEFMKEFIRDNKKQTLYGCELKQCIYCPHRNECVTTKEDIKRGFRTIEDDGYTIYRKEMREKMQQKDAKKIYSNRAWIVEPVFGQAKYNKGFTRFKLKGLDKVKGEATIMAIAHNLGKIIKYNQLNVNLAAANG